jgi:hypothetical protein
MEEHVGNGHILLFAVAANTEWSDLPIKGLFVPLVHRSLAYCAQETAMERSLVVGEEITLHLRTSSSPKLTIAKPDSLEIFIQPQQLVAEKTIRFSNDDIPGVYTVASHNLILDKFAVNIDPDESKTEPSDEKQRDTMFRRIGIMKNSIHTVSQPQEVQRIITESRLGAELWKQFLVAALIIALVEMVVGRDNKRSPSLEVKQL